MKAIIKLQTKKIPVNPNDDTSDMSIEDLLNDILGEQALDDDIDSELRALLDDIDNDNHDDDDTMEVITEGLFIVHENGDVELSYDESELTGMEGSTTKLLFNTSNLGLVSMSREGTVNTMVSFEKGKRHKSSYQTPYMPFDITINTISLKNELMENGSLVIDYFVNVSGACMDRNLLSVSIEKKIEE